MSPLCGIQYNKSINNSKQSKLICEYIINNELTQNGFVIYVDSVISELSFSSNANTFERALEKIGEIIGFKSTRPDKETNGKGPDNLWAIGNAHYLVIECKNEAETKTISKDYCNQIDGSMRWFESVYDNNFTATPIMIHISKTIDEQATAVKNMRVITQEKLTELKKILENL